MDQYTRFELDLMRQWFDAVQDLDPKYLREEDYRLTEKLYDALRMRVPIRIKERR